jgi:hypothetical protein
MKTLFVCSKRRINVHVGEEYDDIIEVDDVPTTDNILEWANRIKGRIRKLEDNDRKDGGDGVVSAVLDGPAPYAVMLANLAIRMPEEDKIRVEFRHPAVAEPEITDPETLEMLSRLDGHKWR